MVLLGTSEIVPTTEDVQTTPIGLGKPLSIRIMSMYPGREAHRELLVTSAVKSRSTYEAKPLAMHYAFTGFGSEPLIPLPSQAGSRIVFYSPSVLDSALDVELRFAYDDFDFDQVETWLDVAAKAAGLPVFAVATALGGVGGAAAGQTILYFAERAVKVVLGAIDRLVDSENDWVASGTISLDAGTSGLRQSSPGYLLFWGNQEPAQVLVPVNGDLNDQTFATRSDAYKVDTTNGCLVYADDPFTVVQEDEPYVVTYVNGAAEKALEGWQTAAVSAALAEKFLNVGGDTANDLGQLLEAYNDLTMATKYSATSEKLKKPGLAAEDKATLERERDAYLKYLQNDDVKEIVTAAESK